MREQARLARFQVTMLGVAESDDELGVWQPPPVEAYAAESSGAKADQNHVSLWQVDLPEDLHLATHALDLQTARLKRAEQVLPDTLQRLQAFIRRSLVQGPESYAARAGAGQPKHTPEQVLADWLRVAGPEASFSIVDHMPEDWQEIAQRASTFFERVRHSLLYFAWVESSSGGHRLGLTTVSWTGHFHTVWGSNQEEVAVEQHARTLELVLHTRAIWLRMALLIARSSVQVGMLCPVNPFLAVPAAWKFFQQALELAEEMSQLEHAPA